MKKFPISLLLAAGSLLVFVTGAFALPLSVNTLAGNVAQGSTNGFGSNARFNDPGSVAADASGNIYVADTGNGTVRKITPAGFASTYAGLTGNFGSTNGTTATARFYGLQGVAVGPAGDLFVADTVNATIRKISPAGIVSTLAGSTNSFNSFDGTGTNAQFFHPVALAVDNASNVYVADSWNHTIRKISPAGSVITLAGLAGYPGAADGTNSKARFNRPAGLALDNSTNLYVADSLNHTIRKITPAGRVSTIAGLAGVWGSADGTNDSARFFQPEGITADGAGNLFVADTGNQIIRQLSPDGTNWIATTVAGLAGTAASSVGTGSAARFNFPASITLDGSGYLYIADSGNNAIRTTRVVQPTLQLAAAGNRVIIAWPTSSPGFTLETNFSLSSGGTWSTASNGVTPFGDNFVVTNSFSGVAAFYRLHKP